MVRDLGAPLAREEIYELLKANLRDVDPSFAALVEAEMLLAPPDEDGDASSAHRVRWEDVGGLEATKQLLTEAAVLPMRIYPYPYPYSYP